MTMTKINIEGIDKAQLLAALWNASQPLGMGFMDPRSGGEMSVEQAQEVINQTPHLYFDYVWGRVMKVNLATLEMDPWLYDRDNGEGSAALVVRSLVERV